MPKNHTPFPPHPAYTVDHVTLRRLLREGACPILEVVAVYPVLRMEEEGASAAIADTADTAGIERWNRAHREAAEAFVAWATDRVSEEARATYAALGMGAAYRYDRRVLSCRLEATVEGDTVTVKRTVSDGYRRGGETVRREAITHWQLPDGTMRRRDQKSGRRGRRFFGKVPKTSCIEAENVVQ